MEKEQSTDAIWQRSGVKIVSAIYGAETSQWIDVTKGLQDYIDTARTARATGITVGSTMFGQGKPGDPSPGHKKSLCVTYQTHQGGVNNTYYKSAIDGDKITMTNANPVTISQAIYSSNDGPALDITEAVKSWFADPSSENQAFPGLGDIAPGQVKTVIIQYRNEDGGGNYLIRNDGQHIERKDFVGIS
jgi:hypothetical protein